MARVRESPTAFLKRTGIAYAPPPALTALGRPLPAGEACPTLFRQPGPEGVRDLFSGLLRRLAPAESRWVWLASDPVRTQRRLATAFGAVAVLEPLRLFPCRTKQDGVYQGVNRRIEDQEMIVWIPPSALRNRAGWDRVKSRRQALSILGPGYAEEQARVSDRLNAYLEELSEMGKAGAPGSPVPWCAIPARERGRLLAEHGVRARWTRSR